MLIDLTLRVTPELRQDAEKNEKMVFSGHLGTHFDVMDKEFPLEYSCRKGIVFDVSGAEGEIALSEKELDRIREEAFVLFYTDFIWKRRVRNRDLHSPSSAAFPRTDHAASGEKSFPDRD